MQILNLKNICHYIFLPHYTIIRYGIKDQWILIYTIQKQAKQIKESTKSISFSKVLNETVRIGLKKSIEKDRQNFQ
ncbi:MAG: hypothetical protein COA77_05705 [Thaumarchaeota archaeon]|nr:MAG: hypothetical protein COA77_05705 [Nitrososphaerota archaeon]